MPERRLFLEIWQRRPARLERRRPSLPRGIDQHPHRSDRITLGRRSPEWSEWRAGLEIRWFAMVSEDDRQQVSAIGGPGLDDGEPGLLPTDPIGGHVDGLGHMAPFAALEAVIGLAEIVEESEGAKPGDPDRRQGLQAGERGQSTLDQRQRQQRLGHRRHVGAMIRQRVPGLERRPAGKQFAPQGAGGKGEVHDPSRAPG